MERNSHLGVDSRQLPERPRSLGIAQLRRDKNGKLSSPLAGQLFWLVTDADGTATRFDPAGNAAPLSEGELAAAAERMVGSNGISSQGMLHDEDAYEFGHHDQIVLPVYRIIANDAETTRYYLDPTSGPLLRRADSAARWQRWLFDGLHRLDFAAWLRARPLWDVVAVTLMLGGLAGSATGVDLAVRRMRSDIVMLVGMLARLRRGRAAYRVESS